MDCTISQEYDIKVRIQQGSVLSPFPYAVVVDIVTDMAREAVQSE